MPKSDLESTMLHPEDDGCSIQGNELQRDIEYSSQLDKEIEELLVEHPFTAGKILASKSKKRLLEYVIACTPYYDSSYSLKTRMLAVKFHRVDEPRCIQCGEVLKHHDAKHFNSTTFEGLFNRFCSSRCEMKNAEVKKLQNETNRARHGCDWTFQSEDFKKKAKQSMNAHHGVDYAQQNEMIHAKADETRAKLYGSKDILATQHGKETLMQSTRKRFYSRNLMTNPFAMPLFNDVEYLKFGKSSSHVYHWKCLECKRDFDARISESFFKEGPIKCYCRCPLCYPKREGKSVEEMHFLHELQKMTSYEVKSNARILDVGSSDKRTFLEIDAYIKDLKLGFEFNGIFYHSLESAKLGKHLKRSQLGYHLKKTVLAEKQGIKLVHVRSDTWKHRQSEMRALIQDMLDGKIDFAKHGKIDDEGFLHLDRSLFNEAWSFEGYEIVEELLPAVEVVECKLQVYHYENCGELVLLKI